MLASCRRARTWEAASLLLRSAAPARGVSSASQAARPSTRTFADVEASARGPALAPVRLGRRVAVVLR